MRAIDADALKEDLTRFYDNEVTARKLIDEQPTIQPEIIRCKDCRLYTQPEQGKVYGRCTYPRDSMPRKQTDFCSRAERREVTT